VKVDCPAQLWTPMEAPTPFLRALDEALLG
jgi:hypothetical protein